MSYIIGLPNCSESNAPIFIQSDELTPIGLFSIDKTVREGVSTKKFLQTQEMADHLSKSGFKVIETPSDEPVFLHGRPWDNHMINKGESFFVLFPETAPYELAAQMILATSSASYFANISADYLYDGKYVLLTKEHDPIYADDVAWKTDEHEERIEIGPVYVPPEQFLTEQDHQLAIDALIKSGYKIISA